MKYYLDEKVEWLNAHTKNNYIILRTNGGVELCIKHEYGGLTQVSSLCTKPVLNEVLETLRNFVLQEENA